MCETANRVCRNSLQSSINIAKKSESKNFDHRQAIEIVKIFGSGLPPGMLVAKFLSQNKLHRLKNAQRFVGKYFEVLLSAGLGY